MSTALPSQEDSRYHPNSEGDRHMHHQKPNQPANSAVEKKHLTHVGHVSQLISIQPDATVSRTILDEDSLHLVLFSFDKGQELTEHTASMPVIIQTIEGTVLVTADGKDIELSPGDLTYLSTRLPHSVLALEPSKMLLSMFDGGNRVRN